MKVVCLNYQNYLGRGDEYVAKLRNMVARNLTIEHDFVVITEADPMCFTNRTGWWHKLSLLTLFPRDFVLYLDLDIVITANIDHLVDLAFNREYPDKFWMRDDFSYSIVQPRVDVDDGFRETLGGRGTCNSSVMLWRGAWQINDDVRNCHGDQNVITRELWPDHIGLLPNESIKSYKYHWLQGQGHGDICVFHGAPKPHEVTDDFVKEHWR